MNLIKFINYPYPFYENSRQGLAICISIGVFIGAFCYFFRPFGLDEVSSFGLLGYGLVSFVICSFYIVILPIILSKYLRTQGWKIYKEILWILLITTSLGIGNYYYSGYVFQLGYSFDLNTFILVLVYTALIAIIPAIAIILYKQLFVYKKIVEEVQKLDSKLISQHSHIQTNIEEIYITSDTQKENFNIQTSDFMVLISSGNYVEIYYSINGNIEKKLIRNNISKVEKQLNNNERLIRCHRSFIINLDKIHHITGNLQGFQLYFEGLDWQVPVSRSYTKTIKHKILDHN